MIKTNNSFCDLIECQDFNNYLEYEDYIYKIFLEEYVNSENSFLGKRLGIRKVPKINKKYNGFIHYICGHDMKYPDFNRCARIKWGKKVLDLIAKDINIKKYNMKIYYKEKRYHILLEKERFLLVIEDKKEYMMLVTAIYLDYNHSLRKKLRDYKIYKIDITKSKNRYVKHNGF